MHLIDRVIHSFETFQIGDSIIFLLQKENLSVILEESHIKMDQTWLEALCMYYRVDVK